MYYILNSNIALRSWIYVPYAYLRKDCSTAFGVTKEEFEILKKCDGQTEIEENELVKNLIETNVILPCEKYGNQLSEWQKHIVCNNRYLPMLNLQITGKCNYNCRHCFNCADNAPLNTEISFEQMITLLNDCVKCGITSFTITGGEPFIHPYFKEILAEIYKRNLFVFELNSNGFFINEKILDYMISIGCKPIIKISFDGIGFHDWMRGHSGAEQKAIDAIKLCLSKGFNTKVQMNANKMNKDTIYQSLCMLEDLGVKEVRLIKTTNAPRWEQSSPGQSFEWNEYYDFLCELFSKYANEEHKLDIDVWQVLYYNANQNYYNFSALAYHDIDIESPICKTARSMMAIASNGEVYPCMQMQGYMTEHNISFGNVFKDGLQTLLGDSKYMQSICTPLKYKINKNETCRQCTYLKYCHGGCPALAVLTHNGDFSCYFENDKTKCEMFSGDYIGKLTKIFDEHNKNR